MTKRIELIHILISAIVVAYVVGIQKLLAAHVLINPYADQLFAFLTSLGFYRLLIMSVFWVVNRSNILLALLWGKEYINGIWSYSYDLNGEKRVGIWRMAQDIYGVSITGYGLDDHMCIRSTFKSITPLFNNQGLREMVFLRTINAEPDKQHIAKTTFYFDNYRDGKLLSAPQNLRAQTLILGGPESGISHIDIRGEKHPKARFEQEVIDKLAKSTT